MKNTPKLIVISVLALVSVGCSITPQQVDQKTLIEHTHSGVEKYLSSSAPINYEVSLAEAIARTLKYNLDFRLEHAKLMIENGNLKMAYLEMLPTFDIEANFSTRNNEEVQNLVADNGQVVGGEKSFTPKQVLGFSAGLQWSILDLGLSYTRAQQQAERVMIMQEQRRKVTQELVKDTISAYWRAWTAQQMNQKVIDFKSKVKLALDKSKKSIKLKARSSLIELDYQLVLYKAIRRTNQLQLQISGAKNELIRLINARQGAEFSLSSPNAIITSLPEIKPQLAKMDLIAMVNRPELRQGLNLVNIAQKGIQAAVLEMLPGISFDYGYNYTNNKLMLNQEWMGGNVFLALDLVNSVIRGPFAIDMADKSYEFEKLKLVATTISVLTQVRVAYLSYLIWKNDYQYAKEQALVLNALLEHALKLEQVNKGNSQNSIRYGIEAINASFDEKVTFARAYETLGLLYYSVGIDILPVEARDLPLDQLTKKISIILESQSRGEFNVYIDAEYEKLLPILEQVDTEMQNDRSLPGEGT